MSDAIPTTREEIDAEILQLLSITPETTERGRLFHLLDAARKLGGGGGIPTTEPTTQLTKELLYNETISSNVNAYQIFPTCYFPVQSSLWDDTDVQAAYIHEDSSRTACTGVIGAKLTATDLEVNLEYKQDYGAGIIKKSYTIAKSTGHNAIWMGTTTFKDADRGNIIITGKTTGITSIELSLYRIINDTLTKLGDTTVTINTNNDIDEMRVNAIPYGSDKILVAVNCDLYNHRQTSVFFTTEADTTVKNFIIERMDHSKSIRPRLFDFTEGTTGASTHYLGLSDDQGVLQLWQDDSGTVTKTGALEDRNGSSYSNTDAVMSVHTTMSSGTTVIFSNRAIFEGSTEIPLTLLDAYNNTLTPLTITLTDELKNKYKITSAMLYTIPWTSSPGIEALLLLEPKEGVGLHIFDIKSTGELIFSGYMSAMSILSRGYTFYGENIRGIIPAASVSVPEMYSTIIPEYANQTRSNKDALISSSPTNVQEARLYDTQENILGAVGIYDPNPVTIMEYPNHGNLLQLPPKDAVLQVISDTTLLIPKDAVAGTQWTLKLIDPMDRADISKNIGLGCPILAEPLAYEDPQNDPSYLAVGIAPIVNPLAKVMGVVHVVKVSDTVFKMESLL
ncbi:hypothetical protein Ares1_0112 [Vibrio phage Ares1]|nr:hypothetical protein Ares1_0112 [Vibrio phage Ares1]